MAFTLKSILPPSVHRLWRFSVCAPLDILDSLAGRRDPLTPPRRLMFAGAVDPIVYRKNGESFVKMLRNLDLVHPGAAILDVGSGIGEKAAALTRYLNEKGSYEGIEIVKMGVDWCRTNVTSRFTNFRFQRIDVYNKYYNPRGKTQARDYRFPCESGRFDLVIVNSVFTHMLPDEVENYLGQIARVLRPGGRCIATYFLLEPESLSLIEEGRSVYNFKFDCGQYRTTSLRAPEEAIALDREYVLDLYRASGLDIVQPIRYGAWCPRENATGLQDFVIAQLGAEKSKTESTT